MKPADGKSVSERGAQRLDKWLWYARFFKARERAAAFIEEGRVRLSRSGGAPERVLKASQLVRPGDVLTFAVGRAVWVLRIEAMATRRGPAQEARTLYAALASDGLATKDIFVT